MEAENKPLKASDISKKLLETLEKLGNSMQGPHERPSYTYYGECINLSNEIHKYLESLEAVAKFRNESENKPIVKSTKRR